VSSRQASPTVSVVVCAWSEDRWNDLQCAIESIERQTEHAAEIILVVDHNDALRLRAEQHFSGLTIVANDGRRGLADARNAGIAAANGQIIAFIDDDAVASPTWLARLVACFLDEKVMGVGGRVNAAWDGRRPRMFPSEFEWVVGCSYRGLPDRQAPVRNMIGANMAFRREVFDAVGGFRSDVGRVGARPLGCEETELCIRARTWQPDATILYEPSAQVSHRVTATRATWRYFVSRCIAEGLSKAAVVGSVGASDGLASERDYTLRTLPSGVARGVADAVVRRDPAGAGRAGAIVAGLALTAGGYVAGRTTRSRAAQLLGARRVEPALGGAGS
jgi:glycosyltransferase involved in cell wall biosynthesis